MVVKAADRDLVTTEATEITGEELYAMGEQGFASGSKGESQR